jgi:hypothetical protein
MSTAKNLQALADLCNKAAHEALEALLKLGPRPASPATAGFLWDQCHTRLTGQINSLTALASKLSASSVLSALDTAQADLVQLATITKTAQARIKKIQEVSELLTTLGRVLDVGLAILAVATAPSPATAAALAQKIKELAKDVAGDGG